MADSPRRRRRLTPFRVVLGLLVVVVAAVAWSAWSAFRAQAELQAADDAYDDLSRAFVAGDREARDAALAELREQARSARERTDGAWWGLMVRAPAVGDDLRGVELLATAFDTVAQDGLGPLFGVVDSLADDTPVSGSQVDLDLLASYDAPVSRARDAFAAAGDALAAGDADSYSLLLRQPFERQGRTFASLERALGTAATATRVLPRMLGADGPRDYLLVLQDNGTVRPSGGRPVSWARVHAEQGRLSIEDQGGPDDFPATPPTGVDVLTADELELYGATMATEFADAGLTPDFPRTAELWAGHYAALRPDSDLDGVVAVDLVTLSAVLQATGPVDVNGIVLRPGNVVGVLASDAHRRLDAATQDEAYALATGALLDAALDPGAGTYPLVLALAAATDQGRVLLAPLDADDAADLAGARVLGALPDGDADGDGETPHVEVTLDDDTGGAMSYYLRREARVEATGCDGDRQRLAGTLDLAQTVERREAAALPDGVTGGGARALVGTQAVVVRLSAPAGGSVDSIAIDGVEQPVRVFGGDRRPTAALRVVVEGPTPVEVTWTMTAGPGQTGAGRLRVTPGVDPAEEPALAAAPFVSAC